MHPNRTFAWPDAKEMLNFVSERSFAHIFTASDEGLFAVHVPVLVTGQGRVQFHVARRNRIAAHLDSRRLLISVSGREGYHSANWYVSDNQVPTWHYEAVEIEGEARQLSPDELVALLDALSDIMERRHSPERPWTRDKMDGDKFEAMTKAIVGFEVEPADMRGTRKFNQHKVQSDWQASIAGQQAAGRDDIVAAMTEVAKSDE